MTKMNIKTFGGNLTAPTIAVAKEAGAEFVDAEGLRTLFGLRRSLAYTLLAEGGIRGVSLRRPGTCRGKRLFCVQSVRDFLVSRMDPQGSNKQTQKPQIRLEPCQTEGEMSRHRQRAGKKPRHRKGENVSA